MTNSDLMIIGGGPAGAGGGVYAARKKLKTLFLTDDFGGQSTVSPDIQNWIGTKSIAGADLAEKLKDHVLSYQGPEFKVRADRRITKVEKNGNGFTATDETGTTYQAKTVLLTTGASRRKLNVPGAKEFEQKGITYCATCDGPLFSDKAVTVIGGGNAGFETAAQLLAYTKHVTLLHHSGQLRADPITVEKVRQNPKMTVILNAETEEIKGDKFVNALVYRDKTSGARKEFKTEGVFVEIGIVPNTDLVKDLVKLNQYKMIEVDPRTQRASQAGVWAAGDCTDGLYHQNNIAAGDAIKALEDIYNYLRLDK